MRTRTLIVVVIAFCVGVWWYFCPKEDVAIPRYEWRSGDALTPATNDAEALALCYERDDVYFLVLSPLGYPQRHVVEDHIDHLGALLYTTAITIPKEEQFDFIKRLYGDLSENPAKWTSDDKAVQGHVDKRFVDGSPMQVYLITAPGHEALTEWKRAIRLRMGLGTVAIHATDSPEETRRLAEFFWG